jgi:hypothetical protein
MNFFFVFTTPLSIPRPLGPLYIYRPRVGDVGVLSNSNFFPVALVVVRRVKRIIESKFPLCSNFSHMRSHESWRVFSGEYNAYVLKIACAFIQEGFQSVQTYFACVKGEKEAHTLR